MLSLAKIKKGLTKRTNKRKGEMLDMLNKKIKKKKEKREND